MTANLIVQDLTFAHGKTPILHQVSLPQLRPGRVIALVGPNGAGKSTLMRCLAGLHRHNGQIDGITADRMLYMPQDPPPASTLTVFEAVLLARQQQGALRVSRHVQREVARTLSHLKLNHLADRTMAQLSGGQRQMVSFAQAVIRQPEVLLLDEPTASLDLHNQLSLLDLIRTYAQERHAVVLVTIHDLSHAARFADEVVVLQAGRVHSSGVPREVITEDMLRNVYRVDASVHETANGALAVAVSGAL